MIILSLYANGPKTLILMSNRLKPLRPENMNQTNRVEHNQN